MEYIAQCLLYRVWTEESKKGHVVASLIVVFLVDKIPYEDKDDDNSQVENQLVTLALAERSQEQSLDDDDRKYGHCTLMDFLVRRAQD